jgi:tetratricopeptide (TPR) repeat protein
MIRRGTPDTGGSAPALWGRVTAVLDVVLAAEPDDQPALVDRLCGSDDELRREVVALLDADRAAGGILEERADLFAAPYVAALSLDDRSDDRGHRSGAEDHAGERISAYRLIRRIGDGGMGAVYLAERDDGQFEQRVAIKLIKPGMDSDEIIARFLRERQILARLEHPNISRLLDGGVTREGLPFFVMEYVEGTPITQYCDAERLTIRARLQLIGHVCRAIDYAHRNLVVHRDLKPSNVLVDRTGAVKLLDFGIATLVAEGDGGRTGTIEHRAFLTPEYASPELLRGEPVVPASDIYQLGVLLYELLTGRRPYAVDRTRPIDALRMVSGDPPPRPSSTFATRTGSPDVEVRSQALNAAPAALRRALSGDLDAVVLKALRHEPERRYDSAGELANDLARHLDGRPVLARDEGLAYRAAKFVGRHRAAVAGVGAAIALLMIASVYYAMRIQAERDYAQLEATKARQSAALLERMFTTWNPTGNDVTRLAAGDVLRMAEISAGFTDAAGSSLETGLPRHDVELRASMLSLLGGLHTSLADFERSGALLERARAIQEQSGGDRRLDLAATLTRQGQLFEVLSRYSDGEGALRRAIEIYDRDAPDAADGLHARMALASLLQRAQRFEEAVVLCQYVLEHTRRNPDSRDSRWLAAWARVELGDLLTQLSRTAEAIGVLDEARREHERWFGRLHGLTLRATFSLAHALRDHGELAQSEERYREALDLARTLFGEDAPRTADMRWLFALLLNRRAKFTEAEAELRQSNERWERVGRATGQSRLALLMATGDLRLERGDITTASATLEQGLKEMRAMLGGSPDEGDILNRLAFIQLTRNDGRGRDTYREAVAFHRARQPNAPLFASDGIEYLAWAMRRMGEPREAEATYRQALTVYRGRVDAGHPALVRAWLGLGESLLDLGRKDEAAAALEEAIRQAQTRRDLNAARLSLAQAALTRAR